MDLRVIQRTARGLCFLCLRRGEIAKHELRQLLILAITPELQDVLDALIHLGVGIVRQHGINNALIQAELAPV